MRALFLLLALFSGIVSADTVPVVDGPKQYTAQGGVPSGSFSSYDALCTTWLGTLQGKPSANYTYSLYFNDFGACNARQLYQGSWNGNVTHVNVDTSTAKVCPSGGYTLDPGGATCSRPDCPSGYDRGSDGQCVKNNCAQKAGQATPNGNYEFGGAVSTWAVGGCLVKCPQRALAAQGGAGYGCTYTGAGAPIDYSPEKALPPDPTKLPPESPKDCTNQGKGYIQTSSGVTCVSAETAPEGQKPVAVENDKTTTKGTPGPDGQPDPTKPGFEQTDTKTTSNGNGTTTTTTTSTKPAETDGNGAKVCPAGYTLSGDNCVKVTTTTEPTADTCVKDPTLLICKASKSGDDKGNGTDPCTDNPGRIGCAEFGDVGPGENLGTRDLGEGGINVVGMASSATCPAGITLPKGIGSFDFGPMCTYAEAMRPIVLALAWIMGLMIVFGLRGNSNG